MTSHNVRFASGNNEVVVVNNKLDKRNNKNILTLDQGLYMEPVRVIIRFQ